MNALEVISKYEDLHDLAEFMDDKDFTDALAKIINIIARDEINPQKITLLIKNFSAWGSLFQMRAQTYMTIKKAKAGTDANYKKNIYFSMSKECHEMAASLKYLARVYE